jgi:hypothetical protein
MGMGRAVRASLVGVWCAVWLMLALGSAGATVILSDFTTNVDGWTLVTRGIITYRATGGNLGGYLDVQDTGSASYDDYIYAPAKFLVDLTAFNGGTLSFDAKWLDLAGGTLNNNSFGTIRLGGATGVSRDLAVIGLPGATWAPYSINLTAAAWGLTEAQWTTLLANVTEIRICLDATVLANEHIGFDNFQLYHDDQPSEEPLPDPQALWLMVAGLALVTWQTRRLRR